MKVLVLGASGMLGHRVYLQFRSQKIETKALARRTFSQLEKHNVFRKEDFIENIDLTDAEKYLKVFDRERPNVIVNCAGATTRKINTHSTADIVALNGELPHRINDWCVKNESKLIHISTDCVFKGTHAPYSEQSPIEAQDLYGLSKAIGEVKDSTHALTLRTSIIGLELEGKTELLEWMILQKDKEARGFKNVIYSGVTTIYLAQLIST